MQRVRGRELRRRNRAQGARPARNRLRRGSAVRNWRAWRQSRDERSQPRLRKPTDPQMARQHRAHLEIGEIADNDRRAHVGIPSARLLRMRVRDKKRNENRSVEIDQSRSPSRIRRMMSTAFSPDRGRDLARSTIFATSSWLGADAGARAQSANGRRPFRAGLWRRPRPPPLGGQAWRAGLSLPRWNTWPFDAFSVFWLSMARIAKWPGFDKTQAARECGRNSDLRRADGLAMMQSFRPHADIRPARLRLAAKDRPDDRRL